MMYELRIDIERVDPNEDCSRPVNDWLLCESDDVGKIETQFSRLQAIFPNTDLSGIMAENRAVYTVFVFKTDEADSGNYHGELDLAAFTNLKKAKEQFREIVSLMSKEKRLHTQYYIRNTKSGSA